MSGTSRAVADERHAKIIHLSRQGLSVQRIAEQVGVHPQTVVDVRVANQCGRWARRLFTDSEIQACLTMLEDGASYNEVARTVGRHVGTVARRFPGYGWSHSEEVEFSRARRAYGSVLEARQ